jgi:radical SAM protein with 4Fe4S-binding SPASM domain
MEETYLSVHKPTSTFAPLVEWQLTTRCNLNCAHCNQHGERGVRPDLSTRHLLTTARSLARAGVQSVTLTGGEPTLRADWPLAAEVLSRHGVGVQLISNGFRFGESEASLARRCKLRMVFLSVDGMEKQHNRIRRNGQSFVNVERAAAALRAEGVPFGFITTVLRPNVGDMKKLSQWVQKQKAALWSVWLGMAPTPMCDATKALWLRPSDIKPLLKRLVALKSSCEILTLGDNLASFATSDHLRRLGCRAISGCWSIRGRRSIRRGCWSIRRRRSIRGCRSLHAAADGDFPKEGRFLPCGAGRELCAIRNDGTLTGCLALPPDQDVGNIADTPLTDLWHRAVKSRDDRLTRLSGRCARCRFDSLCGAGCHALALQPDTTLENRYCPYDDRTRRHGVRRPAVARAASLLVASTMASGFAGCGPSHTKAATQRTTHRTETQPAKHTQAKDVAPPAPAEKPSDTKPRNISKTTGRASWDTKTPAVSPTAQPPAKKGRFHPPSRKLHAPPAHPRPPLPSCCMAHVLRPGCRCSYPKTRASGRTKP